MRSFLSNLAALAVVGLAVGGCGEVEVPRDHATIIVNGQQTTIAMDGSISVAIDGVPELNYDGPAGCAGGYFADTEGITYFRYTARRAFLLYGNQLYRFDGPPREAQPNIIWHRNFGPDKVTVFANCPLP